MSAPEPAHSQVPHRPSPRLHLRLLGGFAVERDGEPVQLPGSAQRLLAFLALRNGSCLRTYVAGQLWLDSPQERSAGSLRSALWRLRRLGVAPVVATQHHLSLSDVVAVDVREVAWSARQLLDRGAEAHIAEISPTQFTAELLPGWDDDWLMLERERLRQQCLHALDALSDLLRGAHAYAGAVEAALAAVGSEPLRESAHRRVIAAHMAEGNNFEAVRQYESYRLLAAEAGLEPSEQFSALLTRLPLRQAGVEPHAPGASALEGTGEREPICPVTAGTRALIAAPTASPGPRGEAKSRARPLPGTMPLRRRSLSC